MGRKGVIKIVEAVIASVILLASITYFISPSIFSEPGVGWSNAMLKLKADDILAVLALNGTIQDAVVLNNGSKLGNEISSMLRGPIDFIVEIEGLPNPVIYVESNKKNLLENLIGTSLNYRGREITIYIKTISWSSLAERPIYQLLPALSGLKVLVRRLIGHQDSRPGDQKSPGKGVFFENKIGKENLQGSKMIVKLI